MPLTKFTMIFELATNTSVATATPKRLGGWTESWYNPSVVFSDVLDIARNGFGFAAGILPSRAALLPDGAAIVGQRLQQVDPVGRSQTAAFRYPGTAGTQQDIPQMGLLYKVPGLPPSQNIRRHVIRGIPDARVVEGEFSPSMAFETALNAYFLSLSQWKFRGVDLSQPSHAITTITTAGVVTTLTPHGLAIGDQVQVLRTELPDGRLVGGLFVVSTIGPGTNVFTVTGWNFGNTLHGRERKFAVLFPDVDQTNISISRIVTKRVGRPFGQYRGRRSRRRTLSV